jgi:hypothetical protein
MARSHHNRQKCAPLPQRPSDQVKQHAMLSEQTFPPPANDNLSRSRPRNFIQRAICPCRSCVIAQTYMHLTWRLAPLAVPPLSHPPIMVAGPPLHFLLDFTVADLPHGTDPAGGSVS